MVTKLSVREIDIVVQKTINTQAYLRLATPSLACAILPYWLNISTPPAITTVDRAWQCSICPESFHRRQERERHRLTHVPYFSHCPLPHCAWRGNRCNLFQYNHQLSYTGWSRVYATVTQWPYDTAVYRGRPWRYPCKSE